MTNKPPPPAIIPAHGGYRDLKSFQTTEIVYDATETAANTIICLIHQANYLLHPLLRQLEAAFAEQGGLTERLYQARTAARAEQKRRG